MESNASQGADREATLLVALTHQANLVGTDLRTGQVAWQLPLSMNNHPKMAIERGRVFVAAGDIKTHGGALFCVEHSSGRPLWRQEFRAMKQEVLLMVLGERVVVGSRAGLYCFDLEGRPLWHEPASAHPICLGVPGRVVELTEHKERYSTAL